MDARAYKQRTRKVFPGRGRSGSASGTTTRSIQAHSSHTLRNGNFGIQSVDLPAQVGAGDEFDVTVRVFNGHTVNPGLGEADSCLNPPCATLPTNEGVCYKVVALPQYGQSASTDNQCLGGVWIGLGEAEHTLTLTAPNFATEFSVDIELRLPDSGTARLGFSVEAVESGNGGGACDTNSDCSGGKVCRNGACVDPGGGTQCSTDADCPVGMVCDRGNCIDPTTGGGGGGAFLPCWIDPNRDCATPEQMAWTAVGLVLLVVIINAYFS